MKTIGYLKSTLRNLAGGLAILGITTTAQATIIGVTGPDSILAGGGGTPTGVFAQQIAPPADAGDNGVGALGQLGFDEAQGVTLVAPLDVDGLVDIPAGTVVNSHMILFNRPAGTQGTYRHYNVVWTFANPVLGVMSITNGSQEVASSSFLGAAGTAYPTAPFTARGLEGGGDFYSVSGNSITVNMEIIEPGDWIRVVTQAQPSPVPDSGSTGILFGMVIASLGAARLTRRKRVCA